MQEFSQPQSADMPPSGNLTDDVVRHGTTRPDAVTFSRGTAGGWHDVTASEFLAEVRATAKGLIAAGIAAGDRIALLSRTRYEWTLLDYAIWFAGAVSVPIYDTSSPDQIGWILSDSGATAVIAETRDHVSRISSSASAMAERRRTWCIEDGGLEELRSLGGSVSDDAVERRRTASGPSTLATIVYTSGTTGRPKGCMLTHGNFTHEVDVAVDALEELFADEKASTLLFLPLAHMFARLIQVGAVKAGIRLGHSAEVATLMTAFEEFRPTFVVAVPRIFEKIFNMASQKATAEDGGKLFDRAAATAIEYSRALEAGRPSLVLRAKHRLFDKLVYAKLRATLGGSCRHAVSGGAPLGEGMLHFYRGMGLTILEGYGLTESTGALTVNRVTAAKLGTVGQPLAGTTARVAPDGELLFRGSQIFTGYWQDDSATSDVLTPDGWLCTGDLGEIDDEGFVRITGRKKEIIVTAGGKSVAPRVLEDRLRAHPLVSQCLVVGDGEPFLAALVTVDPDSFAAWAKQHGRKGAVSVHTQDPDLIAEIDRAVAEVNLTVSKAEAIRKVKILDADWTESDGYLTPSLKLKRRAVLRDFRTDVESLYRDQVP